MIVIVVLYFACAVLLMFYGINTHVLIYLFKRRWRRRMQEDRDALRIFYDGPVPSEDPEAFTDRLPVVTTQLPIFNELNVAERLIDAVAAFVYPAGKHEIQVCDDSTDETREIVARKVAALQKQGIDIKHVLRPDRRGFKAGALKYGLERAKGGYLAIFDADFVPQPDFLLKAMPFFTLDESLGFVQARWGHLNRKESLLTLLQSIGIDGHFMVEQSARDGNNLFMNFNGTAGIFKKEAIRAAGDWSADTLTEDMDLSYRIQLEGWACRYLLDVVAPAEIPSDINAFKSQQFRWAKGSIQTARKLLPRIMRSDFPLFKKFQAALHMTHYSIHPLMLFLAVMALPILVSYRITFPAFIYISFGVLLILACTGPSRMYFVAEGVLKRSRFKILLLLPVMICFGCGLAINNSRAVFEALLGRKSPFIRTPKQGFARKKKYRTSKNILYLLECLTGLWCGVGMYFYFESSLYVVGHFMLLYAIGFLAIGLISWRHGLKYS